MLLVETSLKSRLDEIRKTNHHDSQILLLCRRDRVGVFDCRGDFK